MLVHLAAEHTHPSPSRNPQLIRTFGTKRGRKFFLPEHTIGALRPPQQMFSECHGYLLFLINLIFSARPASHKLNK